MCIRLVSVSKFISNAVSDQPPPNHDVLNFIPFFENSTKSYVGIPMDGRYPLIQGILDPSLHSKVT